jgi:hypothetical protein
MIKGSRTEGKLCAPRHRMVEPQSKSQKRCLIAMNPELPDLKSLVGGADGEIRTHTACAATPSRWCVYQFHHVGPEKTVKREW